MNASKPVPIPFTEEGFKKIHDDFTRLNIKRKEVLIRLQTAREMGDLSENGAYTGAKFELGSIDRQLRQLKYQLKYGVVTESKKIGVVDFGSTVTIDDGSIKQTYQIVSTFESDPLQKKLSGNSPVGKALLGKKEGDNFVVEAPMGKITYTIISVK